MTEISDTASATLADAPRTPEKAPLQSKKFVAFIMVELTWKVILGGAIVLWQGEMAASVYTILLTMVLVAGFVEVGYILGQASLDKYTRLAQIAADAGKVVVPKVSGMKVEDRTPVLPDTHTEALEEEPG